MRIPTDSCHTIISEHRDVTLIRRLIERVRACALHRPLLFGTDGLSADIRAIRETLHDPVPTGKGGRQRKLLTRLQNPRLPTNSLPRVLNIHNQSEREHLWVVRLRVAERGEVPLRISESRLDHGSKAAGNARPVEIAIVHAPGTQYKTLTLLIHALRGRSPYFDGDLSLPFPFQLAIKEREYAVGVRDTAGSLEYDDGGEIEYRRHLSR